MNGLNAIGLNLQKQNFPLLTEHFIAHWELVKQGLGIGIMPEEIGDAEPLLARVLPTLKPIEFPIWLTAHRELNTSRRIRMVFDLLASELS
jgi:DNA-binding transcriptional LysR family regulator